MIIKIIFSDNSVTVIECGNSTMAKALKKAQDDDEANEIIGRYRDHYTIGDESDAKKAGTTVDLRSKKRSNDKQRAKAHGDKYR